MATGPQLSHVLRVAPHIEVAHIAFHGEPNSTSAKSSLNLRSPAMQLRLASRAGVHAASSMRSLSFSRIALLQSGPGSCQGSSSALGSPCAYAKKRALAVTGGALDKRRVLMTSTATLQSYPKRGKQEDTILVCNRGAHGTVSLPVKQFFICFMKREILFGNFFNCEASMR